MLFEALDPISNRCLGFAEEKCDILDVDAQKIDGVQGVVLDLNEGVALDDLLENVQFGSKKGVKDEKEGIAISHYTFNSHKRIPAGVARHPQVVNINQSHDVFMQYNH